MTAVEDQVRRLAAAAEHRGGRDARKDDGAFFTADDVARWLARRAIGAGVLRAAGVDGAAVDELLASGADLGEALHVHCAAEPGRRDAARDRLTTLRVLDPTCGAGAFLVAAWGELRAVEAVLDELDDGAVRSEAPRVTAAQLVGIDRDAGAVTACAQVLELVAGPGSTVLHADALDGIAAVVTGVDVLLGNPPYVRAAASEAPAGVRSASAGNVAAWIVELALAACAPGANVGMVLPVSVASSARWGGLRAAWHACCEGIHAAHFDTIPSTLFPGVVQRLTLLEGRIAEDAAQAHGARWFTTRYHRWRGDERDGLLGRVRHVALGDASFDPACEPIPKLGSMIELGILDKLRAHPPVGRWFVDAGDAGAEPLRYKRRWSYFLLFTDFVPPIWDADGAARDPSELQSIGIDARVDVRVPVAIFSSTLFWWWFSVFTDNRNVNRGELARFPLPLLDDGAMAQLAQLGRELMAALHECGEVRTCTYRSVGTIRNTYYRQAATRPVLDRIDAALAELLGLSAAEREVVHEYERRFRS